MNYNGLSTWAVTKPGYMLENPSIPRYLSYRDDNLVMRGDNAAGADNQQERPGLQVLESSETTRQALSESEQSNANAE